MHLAFEEDVLPRSSVQLRIDELLDLVVKNVNLTFAVVIEYVGDSFAEPTATLFGVFKPLTFLLCVLLELFLYQVVEGRVAYDRFWSRTSVCRGLD